MKKIILLTIVMFTYNFSNAQVGIGTTTPEGVLDITSDTNGVIFPKVSLTATNIQAPVENPKTSLLLVNSTLVYNTNTDGVSPNNVYPGFYYWKDSEWVRLQDDYTTELFELASDVTVTNTTWTDISTMSYTFTAKRTEVIIELTGSGNGTTSAAGNVHFQILYADGSFICSTKTKIQNLTLMYDPSISGNVVWTTTTWNVIAKGKMTGLIINNDYTIKVQGKISNAFGTSTASIDALTDSGENLKVEVR